MMAVAAVEGSVSVAALVGLAALVAVVTVLLGAAAASHPGPKQTKRGGWIKKDTPTPGSKRGVWGKATPTPRKERAQASTDIDGAAHSSAMPRMS